jgi:alkanesulfonate monooxygenase SsuD/methylene tetrahydromethanopterin reductase-like flavin-dependent oxidoreductase (luciferase family)
MKFGIFDYLDQRGEPIAKLYQERIALVKAAEAAGFYGYHVTEHHATPLSTTPSPSVFLAALAQHTTRIRLGALLFLLPLYHPLRLLEELCMLDHLSNGRLDIGVGRGVSPYEFASFGVDLQDSGDVFEEVLDILYQGFTQDRIDHRGKRYKLQDVPVVMRSCQQPHPPFWYGIRGGEHGSAVPAQRGMNGVTLGSTERVAQTVARFRAAWETHAEERKRYPAPVAEPLVGVMRALYVGASDAEAEAAARPAYHCWADSLSWLWRMKGGKSPLPIPLDYDEARKVGTLVVGSPERVRRELTEQSRLIGQNYLVLQLAFGSLTHAEEMNSLHLFCTEVMNHLKDIQPEAKPGAIAANG